MLSDEEAEKRFKEMKLTIAIPENNMWGTSTSVFWSIALCVMVKPEITQFKSDAACPLSLARNRLFRTFYDSDSDWLLFNDTDVVLPFDTIYQMMKYSDEYDILSGLYFRKSSRKGHKPVAFHNLHQDKKGRWWWNSIYRWPKGACKVGGFGLGCCLIPKRAIKQIIEKQGHPLCHYAQDYSDGWLVDGEKDFFSMGEDLYFCKKAIDSGLKLGLVTGVVCEHTGPHASVTEGDFLKAFSEGKLIGQTPTLAITNVDQKLIIGDLANYLHLQPDRAIQNMSFGTDLIIKDLKTRDLSTQKNRNNFYYDNESYLYYLLGWNYFYHDKVRSKTQLALVSEGSVLDYGGGCGDVSIKCSQLGLNDITYYERPGVAYDFVKWRAKKHDYKNIKFIELNDSKDTLGDKKFDTIICFDFLEYVLNPVGHLKRMREHSHEKTKYLLGIINDSISIKNPLHVQHKKGLSEMLKEAGINPGIVLPQEMKKLPGIQDEKFNPIDKM